MRLGIVRCVRVQCTIDAPPVRLAPSLLDANAVGLRLCHCAVQIIAAKGINPSGRGLIVSDIVADASLAAATSSATELAAHTAAYARARADAHARAHTRARTHTCSLADTCTHTHVRARARTHARTHIHAHTRAHACKHTRTHRCTHARTHRYAGMPAHTMVAAGPFTFRTDLEYAALTALLAHVTEQAPPPPPAHKRACARTRTPHHAHLIRLARQ